MSEFTKSSFRYKRNVVDEYTIPYFSLDNLEMASQHPEFLSVGGNTGKVSIQTCDILVLRRRRRLRRRQ